MSIRYNVIFDGKTTRGRDVGRVKESLKSLLKTDDRGIDRLFSGRPVIIRKNVDAASAEKFQKAFEGAGAVVRLEPTDISSRGSGTDQTERAGPGRPASGKTRAKAVTVHTIKTADGGDMIITNIENLPGKTIVEHFGLVSGSTIRAKHVGRDIMASLKNLVGGELKGYTQLLQESRRQAMDRMIEQARQLGANAIVNVRFSTSSVAQGAAELYAYGTALRVE